MEQDSTAPPGLNIIVRPRGANLRLPSCNTGTTVMTSLHAGPSCNATMASKGCSRVRGWGRERPRGKARMKR